MLLLLLLDQTLLSLQTAPSVIAPGANANELLELLRTGGWQEAANNEVATENELLKAENSIVAATKAKFAEEIDWANQTLEEALSENETLLVVACKLAVTMLGAVLVRKSLKVQLSRVYS